MKIELILEMDKSVVEKAEHFAKKTGKSLSELIGSYLESLGKEHSPLSSKLESLLGAVQLPDDFDEKEKIGLELEKKHWD